MSSNFYDTTGNDDTVRLLSNPLNNENFHSDETEDAQNQNSYCVKCSVSLSEVNTLSHDYLSNEHPVQTSCNGGYLNTSEVHSEHVHSHSRTKLLSALSLCAIFMVAEMVGGYLAGSVAVVSDGAHLLTDIVGFSISLIALSTSKKKSTKNFNLGFYRIEVLTAVSSILLIWLMTAVFIYVATIRLVNGNYSIDVDTMMIMSSLGVVINIVMYLVLHGSCHPKNFHSHHIQTSLHANESENINVRAAIVHVIGDLLQSIGVFISSIIIKFYPNAKFMDPMCTFLFSVIVLSSTIKLWKDSIIILMEGFPRNVEYSDILMSLKNLNGVCQVHNLCVWSLSLDKNILMVHLVIEEAVDADALLIQAQRIITSKFGILNHAIQIEKLPTKCNQDCQNCRLFWS